MARSYKVAILSDVHYACTAEQARGDDYEYRDLKNPALRLFVKFYRYFVWLRYPLRQNHLLDEFINRVGSPDYVIANGDYSCNSASIGVSDAAACTSASECLQKLREKFGPQFQATFGDHELGKVSFFGMRGGMRLASWHSAQANLKLKPAWRVQIGNYVLIGVASSLVGLPVFEADTLPDERPEWYRIREDHLLEIRQTFASITSGQRILLFCHDPTALPYLHEDEVIRSKIPQIERTVIGHLHSNLVFWKSRLLAGIPTIRFLGHTARRMSAALNKGKFWKPFRVMLCPSLAGIELLKDGGFYMVELDEEARNPARFTFHPIPRKSVSLGSR